MYDRAKKRDTQNASTGQNWREQTSRGRNERNDCINANIWSGVINWIELQ